MNERDFFRIPVGQVPCGVLLTHSSSRPLLPVSEPVSGSVLNLSAGGLLLQLNADWDVRQNLTVRVSFSLLGEKFELDADLLRKTDTRTAFEYGGAFTGLPERERSRLLRVLNQYQVNRRLEQKTRR